MITLAHVHILLTDLMIVHFDVGVASGLMVSFTICIGLHMRIILRNGMNITPYGSIC